MKVDTAFQQAIEGKALAPLERRHAHQGQAENYGTVARLEKKIIAGLPEDQAARKGEAKGILHGLQEKVLRDEILVRGVRLDGRKFDEIRPITIENSVLPRTHGSSLFTRGETQALVTVTLGTAGRRAADRDGRRRDRGSASCSTTTSRRSRSARSSRCAAPAAARSATARWPSGRWCR